MVRKYRLRTLLSYADGKTIAGIWDGGAVDVKDMACSQSRVGLVSAKIQAKDLQTCQIEDVAECLAGDYVGFQWLSYTSFKGTLGLQNSIVAGLTLETKTERVTAFIDGSVKAFLGENK